jgi:ankyrin repeat protein
MKYIKLFEDKGIDLFNAILKGDINRIKHLIRTGTDINIKAIDGRTPLFYAAQHDYMQIVNILIEAGADWNVKNNKGYYFTYLLTDKQYENIIKNYPNEYNNYLIKKEAEEKFNL